MIGSLENENYYIQLRRERTEERRKVFQLADKKRRGTDPSDSNFTKWNKLLESVPEAKTSIELEKPEVKSKIRDGSDSLSVRSGFLGRLLKKASKSSNTSEEAISQLEKDNDHTKKHGGNTKTKDVDKMRRTTETVDSDKVEDVKDEMTAVNRNVSKEETAEEAKDDEDSLSQAKCEGRPREDSIASSIWSSENIPEIKIIESAGERVSKGIGSKSSSSDTVIAVGLEEGRKRAPLARSKLNSEDLSDDVPSDNSYQDMAESIKKIHSLTNVRDVPEIVPV